MTQEQIDLYDLPEAIERIAQKRKEPEFALTVQVPQYTFEIAPDTFSGLPFEHRGKTYTYAGRSAEKQKGQFFVRFVVTNV
jgi:hypothetical protein